MPEQPCPHVTPAMIAAGFTRCAVCEANPGRDNTADQETRLRGAFDALADSLRALAREAETAAKVCGRKRPAPDLDRVRASVRDLDLAEQAVDAAQYDLDTARGADG